MPGAGIPAYRRKAAQMARAGIYDLRIHHDEVVWPMLRHWRIFELDGLAPSAEAARDRLAAYLTKLDASARRFEERRAADGTRAIPGSTPDGGGDSDMPWG